jgi:phosphoribosyl-dephospho-CoA transferase
MKSLEIGAPQVHDLLQIETDSFTTDSGAQPLWVREMLVACPWVVVRRDHAPDGTIAVGVRGTTRSQRWPGFLTKNGVKRIIRPANLAVSMGTSTCPRTRAIETFRKVAERWRGFALLWGPTGSVGFELATGCEVTTEASDLDIVIHAPARFSIKRAQWLCQSVISLCTRVDIRIETRNCGFLLEEYARNESAQMLLRYPDGVRIGEDPWAEPSYTPAAAL